MANENHHHVRILIAQGISNTGWITGIGQFDPGGAGRESAYVRLFLIQIPEPSALLLAAMGLVVALACRRRRSGAR